MRSVKFSSISTLCILCTFYSFAKGVWHCGEWSPWYNFSTPAMYNGSEEREKTPTEVYTVCGNDRTITCKDDKGEPFHDKYNITSGDKKYVYSCSAALGATCFTIETNATCPDFAIQFYCDCQSTLVSITSTTVSTASTISAAVRTRTTPLAVSRNPESTLAATVKTKTTPHPGTGNRMTSDFTSDFGTTEKTGSTKSHRCQLKNSRNSEIIPSIFLALPSVLLWLL